VKATAKIKFMLRRAVLQLLDRLDPPKPKTRPCPSCHKPLLPGSISERGEFDYCVCTECGEASVWKGFQVVAGEDVFLEEEP